jgi:hypothetical protein
MRHNVLETGPTAAHCEAMNEAFPIARAECLKTIRTVIVSDELQELACRGGVVLDRRGRQPSVTLKMNAVRIDQTLCRSGRRWSEHPALFKVEGERANNGGEINIFLRPYRGITQQIGRRELTGVPHATLPKKSIEAPGSSNPPSYRKRRVALCA